MDPARSLSQVCGRAGAGRGPAAAEAATRALEAGTLACAAQLLGAGRALLEASVRQATQRSQFGQPIGSFQAVKHHLADVAIGLEFARPLLDAAAAALELTRPEAGPARAGDAAAIGPWYRAHAARDVSAAKIACTDAAYRAARAALQVHGAIGYTQEHDLHLWLMKVRALAGAWGSQAEHRARVMAASPGRRHGPDQRAAGPARRGPRAAGAAASGGGKAAARLCGRGCAARSARPASPSPNATAGPGPARPRRTS